MKFVASMIVGFFALVKTIFISVKAIVDVIYKTAFFIAVGFVVYKIYTNATMINGKLDGIMQDMQKINTIIGKYEPSLKKVNTVATNANNLKEKLKKTVSSIF